MRNLLIFMALIGFFVVGKKTCTGSWSPFGGVKGKGPIQTETRALETFRGVDMQLSGKVILVTGDQYSVTIQAQENLMPIIQTAIEEGVLQIFSSENIRSDEPIVLRVTAPAYTYLSISGHGEMEAESSLEVEKMVMSVGGAGTIRCPQANFGLLKTSITGSGDIEVGGKSAQTNISISGAGDFNGKLLVSDTLRASISGAGTVTADVQTSLEGHVSGAGNIYYTGSPAVSSSVSGVGKIKKIAD